MWYRILKLWHKTGDVVPCRNTEKRGWPRLLDREDIEYLLQLIQDNPDFFLDENPISVARDPDATSA
jgi:hypothetical protein